MLVGQLLGYLGLFSSLFVTFPHSVETQLSMLNSLLITQAQDSMSVIWSKFIQFVLNLFATVFFQIKASLYISPDCLFCTSSAFTSETGFPICRGPMDVFFKSQVPQKMRNCLTSYLIIIIVMILIMLIVIIFQTYCPQIKASKNLFFKRFFTVFQILSRGI